MGPAQEEPLARLEWLIEERQRLGLVLAPSGCGKSHLAAMAVRRLGGLGAEATLLSLRGLREGDWLDLLLDRLPLDPLSAAEPLRPWQKLENRLRENTLMERPTVLVFDDLHEADREALAGIERLVSAAEPRFGRLLVIATIATDAEGRMPADPRHGHLMGHFFDKAAVRVELSPWSEADTAAFLAWAVKRTGRRDDLFSPTASAALARLAAGIPRRICQLARLAVVACDAEGLSQIDPVTVERVWRELVPVTTMQVAPADESHDPAPQAHPRVRPVRRLWG
jgi:type II secretory pathway predicted ATPase ExeA